MDVLSGFMSLVIILLITGVLLYAALIIYFLPTIIAKDDPKCPSIFMINLFLGWTFVGWLVAFVLAVLAPVTENNVQVLQQIRDRK